MKTKQKLLLFHSSKRIIEFEELVKCIFTGEIHFVLNNLMAGPRQPRYSK